MSDSGSDSEFSSTEYSSSESESVPAPQIPRVLANWYLEETLGAGYSGSIYKAKHIHSGVVVALKVQSVHHDCRTNLFERHFFPKLRGGKGMPTLWADGVQHPWDYLAMDLLGPSLDSLFRKSGADCFDLGSVCSIAMQMIERLEFMHSRGVLHRDIQLGNCTIGLGQNAKTIYMIDFGFSKIYIDQRTGRHIPDSRAKRDFIGNYWFSSVNVHCKGRVPTRRDDLEATALMLIHMLTPRGLTWTRNGVPKTSAAHDLLIEEKRLARPEDLCRGLPEEFEDFLRYTRKLKFEQQPDYSTWIENFRQLKIESGYSSSDEFVWPPPKPTPKPVTVHTPLRIRVPPRHTDSMENILQGLNNLVLEKVAQPLIGDRPVQKRSIGKAPSVDKAPSKSKTVHSLATTAETSSQATEAGATRRYSKSKSAILADLSIKVSSATDNAELAGFIKEFVDALQMNSSRALTKEAFNFLDNLRKQLDDPSVFIQPKRITRDRSFNEGREPSRTKLGVIARLRFAVKTAPNNKALGNLVFEFAQVTGKSIARTITKDGFLFLEGVADRLRALQ
ncbi:CK1/CK1 protein kinase [Coprinopsis sp. MPI-PUGE-AT-0042]|nr:CK1/CK1 protein kinase [Coprinopsis sp. MPI-PUGE-AT-0042]